MIIKQTTYEIRKNTNPSVVFIEVYKRKMQEKAVRKNVSLPAWLAAEAEKAHVNLSRVLQDALKEKLNIA